MLKIGKIAFMALNNAFTNGHALEFHNVFFLLARLLIFKLSLVSNAKTNEIKFIAQQYIFCDSL